MCFVIGLQASGSAARVFDLINRRPRMDIHKGIELSDEQFKGHIEFKNVTFAYDAPPDPTSGADENVGSKVVEEKAAVQVLKNFSLDIPAGHTIALVRNVLTYLSTSICLQID